MVSGGGRWRMGLGLEWCQFISLYLHRLTFWQFLPQIIWLTDNWTGEVPIHVFSTTLFNFVAISLAIILTFWRLDWRGQNSFFSSLVNPPTGNGCIFVGTVKKREADLSMNLALTGAFIFFCSQINFAQFPIDGTILYFGGSGGKAGGRSFNEPGFDWSEGEGGRLLCCLYRLVSSLSLSLSFVQYFTFQMTLSHFLSRRRFHCHRFWSFYIQSQDARYFVQYNLLQWYSIYRPYEPQAWLLLLAVMLLMGVSLRLSRWIQGLSSFVFQVLSWV